MILTLPLTVRCVHRRDLDPLRHKACILSRTSLTWTLMCLPRRRRAQLLLSTACLARHLTQLAPRSAVASAVTRPCPCLALASLSMQSQDSARSDSLEEFAAR